MTVKEFVNHMDPLENTIPTQILLINKTPVCIRQCMTKREGENVWLNKFTGEVLAKPHDFIIIQAYNDHLDGPIIAIIYDEPELNWFNDWSLWSEELEDPQFVNQVLKMNELIHYITKEMEV